MSEQGKRHQRCQRQDKSGQRGTAQAWLVDSAMPQRKDAPAFPVLNVDVN